MPFISSFNIRDEDAPANKKVAFESTSDIGLLIEDGNLGIDGPVTLEEINIEDYTVTSIDKIEWVFSDGEYYYGDSFDRKFNIPDTYFATIKIWSNSFNLLDGRSFKFTHTSTREFRITSRFYNYLKEKYGSWEAVQTKEFDDYMLAAGRFFDMIHTSITELYDMNDVEKIDPRFFEYLALNFGHDEEYSKKVGYIGKEKFEEYDIFTKIKNKVADKREIEIFRRFIIESSLIFSGKGTQHSLRKFLSFFSIDAKAIELWTEYWGEQPIGLIEENFIGSLSESKLELEWENMRVLPYFNDDPHIVKKEGYLQIDNYFKSQKVIYPTDTYVEFLSGGIGDSFETIRFVKEINYEQGRKNLDGTIYYDLENTWFTPSEINSILEQLQGDENRIIYSDYEDLTEKIEVGTFKGFCIDYETNRIFIDKPVLTYLLKDIKNIDGTEVNNLAGNWSLFTETLSGSEFNQTNPFANRLNFIGFENGFLDEGTKLSIQYNVARDSVVENVVATKVINAKDGEIICDFKFPHLLDTKDIVNYTDPANEIFFIFRGQKQTKDNYSDIDEFYRVGFNQLNSTYNLSKVIHSKTGEASYQQINLSGDKNNKVFDALLPITLDSQVIHRIKVSFVGKYISISIAKLEEETNKYLSVSVGSCDSSLMETEEPNFIKLVDSLYLDTDSFNIRSIDKEGREFIVSDYTPILKGGNIGFGIRNGTVDVHYFAVNVFDSDETLYTTSFKEINLKPRYQEWIRNKLIKFDSYENKIRGYVENIGKDVKLNETYEIQEENLGSLNYLFLDNVEVTDEVFTRFTVSFDKEWLRENYSTERDGFDQKRFQESIIVPLGKQRFPFITEYPWINKELYAPYSSEIGSFFYNPSPVLDNWNLQPFDNLSRVERTIQRSQLSYELSFVDKMKHYISSGCRFDIKGVYEEVTPLSTYFPEIDGTLVLNNTDEYRNKLFHPVTQKSKLGWKVLGVHFKNCSDIDKIYERLSSPTIQHLETFGSYEFHVPAEATQYAPDSSLVEDSDVIEGFKKFKIFVPLGILSREIKTYSLSKSFFKMEQEYLVQMVGFYIRVPGEHLNYDMDNFKIHIQKPNPYEDAYNELLCQYWVAGDIQLGFGVYRDDNIDLELNEESTIPFFLEKPARNLLSISSSKDEILWWNPLDVWRKRRFQHETLSLPEDLATNLNYEGNPSKCEETFSKIFFGNKIGGKSVNELGLCDNVIPPLTALRMTILDGEVDTGKIYWAKIKLKINYSGITEEGFKLLSNLEQKSTSVIGSKRKTKDFRFSPWAQCLDIYLPITWKDTNDSVINWGNFIQKSYGGRDDASFTFVPALLMTEIMETMTETERSLVIQDAKKDFTEWNEYFANNMTIEFIAEKVDKTHYKLFNRWGLLTDEVSTGSRIDVKYNTSSTECEVIDTAEYFFDETETKFWNIPPLLLPIEEWIENIRSITINNFKLNSSQYELNRNQVKVNKNKSFDFTGSELYGSYLYKLNLDAEMDIDNIKITEKVNDFFLRKEIKFIPYESNSTGVFTFVKRIPSLNLLLNSEDKLYEEVAIAGKRALVADAETGIVDFTQIGAARNSNKITYTNSSLPNIQKLYAFDSKESVFDIEANVYFDDILDGFKDYNGKKFEFILKSTPLFITEEQRYCLDNYYFVGIGTYDFDIALGVATYDPTTKEMKKSILASFGDWKTKNIITNKWYNFRVVVSRQYIRVLLDDLLVLNYDISSDPSRYLLGGGEQEQYIVKGLESLNINYPISFSRVADSEFIQNNFNEDVVKNVKPNGLITGFSVFNRHTFVTDIKYKVEKSEEKRCHTAFLVTDKTALLSEFEKLYGGWNSLKYYGKLNNGNEILFIDDKVYYKKIGSDISLLMDSVRRVIIKNNLVIMDTETDVIVADETLQKLQSVRVKDEAFNTDSIHKYLQYTGRFIRDIYLSGKKLIVVFGDVLSTANCMVWGFDVWGDKVWGCDL